MNDAESSGNAVIKGPAAPETRREFLGKVARSIIAGGVLVGWLTPSQTAPAGCGPPGNVCLASDDVCPLSNTCIEHTCPAADECSQSDTCSTDRNAF